MVPSLSPSSAPTAVPSYVPTASPSTVVPTLVPSTKPTVEPTYMTQNTGANAAIQLTTPMIAGMAVVVVLCLVAVVVAIVCFMRPNKEEDHEGQIQLRDWIQANQNNVDVAVYASPIFRRSVIEPRVNDVPSSQPRFTLFNQNPFAIVFRSLNPKTEAEFNVTMDEQYDALGVVPDTSNPHALRRPDSVRIHLPITSDTEAFEFNFERRSSSLF